MGVQVPIHVRSALDHPGGEFGGDFDPVAVTVAQGLAQEDFAFARMVGPGGVEVVDAVFDGVADLADGPRFVYLSLEHRQAHAPESQDGEFIPVFRHFSVQHGWVLITHSHFSLGWRFFPLCGEPVRC